MKNVIRKLYRLKVYITIRFNWGFGEISTYFDFVKNIGLFLTFAKILLGLTLAWWISSGFAALVFISIVILGITMEHTGMIKFAAEETNRQNPQMNKIDEIYTIVKYGR